MSLTADQHRRIGNLRVVASVSGGKDSAAMSLWLTENDVPHDRVFLDTGWEAPETYEYLRGPLTAKLGPILEVRGPHTMQSLVEKKAMFPSRVRRFCTSQLKVLPMAAHMKSLDYGVVNAVGIRRAESKARSRMPEWEFSETFDCDVWRPLIHWSEQDVIDIHTRHGLKPNPLYLAGASRVGCWPCIFSRKAEIRFLAEKDPARIATIRQMEIDATTNAAHVAAVKNTELRWARTFFSAIDRDAEPWAIDKVVEWSRTSRGGRQFELFDAGDGEAGCMRWGLCETNSDEEPKP